MSIEAAWSEVAKVLENATQEWHAERRVRKILGPYMTETFLLAAVCKAKSVVRSNNRKRRGAPK